MSHGALQVQRDGTKDGWSGRGIPGPHPPGLPESSGDQCLIGLGWGWGWGGRVEKVGEEEKDLLTVEDPSTADNVLTHLLLTSWHE